jgi:hypothetical protein
MDKGDRDSERVQKLPLGCVFLLASKWLFDARQSERGIFGIPKVPRCFIRSRCSLIKVLLGESCCHHHKSAKTTPLAALRAVRRQALENSIREGATL